ncbi:hypothetical protein TNCV_2332181 [Trichonephila clavipes]|nr:hypothetical protein TNCV_2332181 [Trichonephila clavipes]
MIDRFQKWPEAQPLKDITAETVAEAFFPLGCLALELPAILTADRVRQFESSLFKALSKLLRCSEICKPAFFLNTEDLQLPQTKNETPATGGTYCNESFNTCYCGDLIQQLQRLPIHLHVLVARDSPSS